MKQGYWKEKRDIIRHYNELKDAYCLLYSDEQNLKIKLALDAVHMKSSDLVLDMGCGSGFLFDQLNAAKGLIGIDISIGLLKLAAKSLKGFKKRFPTALICSDADYLPLKEEIIDKVFALTILQNIPNYYTALREIMRVAKKDSTIVITGLKKSFSEEGLKSIVAKAGLELSLVKGAKQGQDIIAVCWKSQKLNDEK